MRAADSKLGHGEGCRRERRLNRTIPRVDLDLLHCPACYKRGKLHLSLVGVIENQLTCHIHHKKF